jgi:hypothetical protein
VIEDAQIAVALGWTRESRMKRMLLRGLKNPDGSFKEGAETITTPIVQWIDPHTGEPAPLRPFTESYDVIIEEATKRGFNVAFRTDEDVALVWEGDDQEGATAAKGLKLVEGMAAALVHRMGALWKLPAGIQAALLKHHLSTKLEPKELPRPWEIAMEDEVVPDYTQPRLEAGGMGGGSPETAGLLCLGELDAEGGLRLPRSSEPSGDRGLGEGEPRVSGLQRDALLGAAREDRQGMPDV